MYVCIFFYFFIFFLLILLFFFFFRDTIVFKNYKKKHYQYCINNTANPINRYEIIARVATINEKEYIKWAKEWNCCQDGLIMKISFITIIII